jgi:epoxyqueuosine reductase
MLSTAAIKHHAAALGFDLCGIAPAHSFPELAFLKDWLARGYAGEMQYMHHSAERRADIRHFLPSARSVIVTATNYNADGGRDPGTGPPPLPQRASARSRRSASGAQAESREPDAIQVAKYARGQDYHKVLAERLHELREWMRAQSGEPFDAEIFVDKHHVQERVFAQYGGLGWIGKNTCLINRDQGSWLFLAGMATSLELEIDEPGFDQCGECSLCIEACPTGALVDARVMDATKCISYLTIEVDGPIPEAQRAQIGNHAYGCDICQDVCPWNLAAAVSGDPAWRAPKRDGLSASDLWRRSDFDLHQLIKGSAMTYLPLSRLRRNLATVIGNTGNRELAGILDQPGDGVRNAASSTTSPVVADAIAWARQRLSEGATDRD